MKSGIDRLTKHCTGQVFDQEHSDCPFGEGIYRPSKKSMLSDFAKKFEDDKADLKRKILKNVRAQITESPPSIGKLIDLIGTEIADYTVEEIDPWLNPSNMGYSMLLLNRFLAITVQLTKNEGREIGSEKIIRSTLPIIQKFCQMKGIDEVEKALGLQTKKLENESFSNFALTKDQNGRRQLDISEVGNKKVENSVEKESLTRLDKHNDCLAMRVHGFFDSVLTLTLEIADEVKKSS